jgi:hypothetical protein
MKRHCVTGPGEAAHECGAGWIVSLINPGVVMPCRAGKRMMRQGEAFAVESRRGR